MDETNCAVSAHNITKSFGAVRALDGVSLDIPYGTVFGLLGPNGAGKTTFVRALATLLKPDSGTATIADHDILHDGDKVRASIGLTGQYAAIDEYLTGRENLELVGKLYHWRRAEIKMRAAELLEKFSLTDAADRPSKTYSGGMRRRLDLAMSLFNRPRVLFLDEPTTGLDPQSRIALWHIIKELVADGTTVLLTTQYLEEADHLCDQIIVIDHGRVIASGTPAQLKKEIGGDVLEVHVTKISEAPHVGALLAPLGTDAPHIEYELGMISLSVPHGPHILIEAVRLLDGAHIDIADIALRRPTLDDVFLALTGGSKTRPAAAQQKEPEQWAANFLPN